MTYSSGPRVIQESQYFMTYIRTFATQRYIHVYKTKRDCWPSQVIPEWSSRCLFWNTLIHNHLDRIQMERWFPSTTHITSYHQLNNGSKSIQRKERIAKWYDWYCKPGFSRQIQSNYYCERVPESEFSSVESAWISIADHIWLKKQALPQGQMNQKVSWGPLLSHISRILCSHHYPSPWNVFNGYGRRLTHESMPSRF